jgi:Ni/Co efflux regulator RcnB
MKKTRISIIVAALVMASPLAHASLASGAHQFKEDARTAGRDTGHAVGHAARAVGHGAKSAGQAIGHGAKSAGHAVADATKHGYHATKKFVTGHA